MKVEYIYKDRDNANEFILKEEGTAVDLSGVTKIELSFDNFTISSDDYPSEFDWSEGDGKLYLTLGFIDDFEKDSTSFCELIVYDTENTEGIHWGFIIFKII